MRGSSISSTFCGTVDPNAAGLPTSWWPGSLIPGCKTAVTCIGQTLLRSKTITELSHPLPILAIMKTTDLRIVFVVDAIQGRKWRRHLFPGPGSQSQPACCARRAGCSRYGQSDASPGSGAPPDLSRGPAPCRGRAWTRYLLSGGIVVGRLGIPLCITYQTDYQQLESLPGQISHHQSDRETSSRLLAFPRT